MYKHCFLSKRKSTLRSINTFLQYYLGCFKNNNVHLTQTSGGLNGQISDILIDAIGYLFGANIIIASKSFTNNNIVK